MSWPERPVQFGGDPGGIRTRVSSPPHAIAGLAVTYDSSLRQLLPGSRSRARFELWKRPLAFEFLLDY